MPLSKIDKLTDGLARDWSGFLRDWDRTLRAGNYPETTRYNYLLAAAELARYLAEHSPDPDAAADPTEVTKKHIESFQAWMIENRSASTALNKYKGLQQFFRWPLDEDEIARSPMDRVKQSKTPQKLIPVIRDDDSPPRPGRLPRQRLRQPTQRGHRPALLQHRRPTLRDRQPPRHRRRP